MRWMVQYPAQRSTRQTAEQDRLRAIFERGPGNDLLLNAQAQPVLMGATVSAEDQLGHK